MTSHRALALIAAVAAISGCTDRTTLNEEPVFVLFVGGVHIGWVSDTVIELEGYMVNTAGVRREFAHYGISPALDGLTGGHLPDEVRGTDGATWEPNEHRTFWARFDDVDEGAFEANIRILEEEFWLYHSDCWNPDQTIGKCGSVEPTARITTRTEPAWHDQLRACCNWLPPPVDVYRLACQFDGNAILCDAVLWNYTNQTALTDAQLRVWSSSTLGTRTEVYSTPLIEAFEIPAESEIAVNHTFEVTRLLSAPGTSYSVEIDAWQTALPRSRANETTPLPTPFG